MKTKIIAIGFIVMYWIDVLAYKIVIDAVDDNKDGKCVYFYNRRPRYFSPFFYLSAGFYILLSTIIGLGSGFFVALSQISKGTESHIGIASKEVVLDEKRLFYEIRTKIYI